MLDIETLGKGDDATVFQISAIAFNLFTGQYLDEIPYFNEVADIEKNNILNVDGSTLKWWLRTDKQLLTELLHKGEKSTNEILVDFYEWLLDRIKDYGKENVYLWGYGIFEVLKKEKQELEEKLKSEQKRLREIIGSYKRKLEDRPSKRACLREGYDQDRNSHYKVYVVQDIPVDLDIIEVLKVIKESFLPEVYPYRFKKVDFSTKHNAWLVEVDCTMYADMFYNPEEKLLKETFGNNDSKGE